MADAGDARERRRVVVVGGGITGLAAAVALVDARRADGGPAWQVSLHEAGPTVGGKIRTSPFAGHAAVDEGADAFLARVPWATALAGRVGLGAELVAPSTGAAAVWWDGLHRIPGGLVLGVPTELGRLATSRLLSWRGKVRAATEVLRPAIPVDHDSIGRYVRDRFGDEVHERLVDPLVGSIYGTDTDRFSLAAVPQLDDLARRSRSVLLSARRSRAGTAPSGPVFWAPRGGMADLVAAAARAVEDGGGQVRTGAPCTLLEPDGPGWRVDGHPADAVVLACPAVQAARLLPPGAAADALARIEYADVVLVTVAVPSSGWPARLAGLSGYLVPKPVQQLVTAVSFGSQKWAHWASEEHVLLRISLGRDGLPVDHLDDARLVAAALEETSRHLGVELVPTDVRVSRWPRAFPQYRPHHARLVTDAEAALPPTVALAGASYHGIGIPACIRSGEAAAELLTRRLGGVLP